MSIPYWPTCPEMSQLLEELSPKVVSCTKREMIKDLHQISNVPAVFAPGDDGLDLSYSFLMQFPSLQVVSVTNYSAKSYSAMGEEEESRLSTLSVIAALEGGDVRLALEADEFDSWGWMQYVPSILRGENSDWRIMAAAVDTTGLDFTIMHAKPLADGHPQLKRFLTSYAPGKPYNALIRTADGREHFYFQSELLGPADGEEKVALLVTNPDGTRDFNVFEESARPFQSCMYTFHCC